MCISYVYAEKEPLWPEKVSDRPDAKDTRPLLVWKETGYEGETLPLHIARINVEATGFEIIAAAEAAPGDAQRALARQPEDLAEDARLLLAINANAFEEGGALQKLMARPGRAVSLYGAAISEGHPFPGTDDPYAGSLWVRPDGSIVIDTLKPGELLEKNNVKNAVSGFHQLVKNGQVIDWATPTGTEAQRVARSAAGMSADGRWLYLVVAEGRSGLFSESGYTEPAIARLFVELGCAEALMLDGGGSAVLLANFGQGPSVLNRTAKDGVRPVPVLLGVRAQASPSKTD